MKTLRSRRGPFAERPHFSLEEIERTCSEELRGVGLYPSKPEPIRIDRFIEKRFGVTPEYEDLPAGILGYTRFSANGVAGIVVSQTLDDGSGPSGRRVRSTLAHEAGHGLFHTHLFVLAGGQSALFAGSATSAPPVMCRDEKDAASAGAYKGEWWEYQANRAIGALLVPRPLAVAAMDGFLQATGSLGIRSLPRESRRTAVAQLAEVFDVNPAVASIRLQEMFPLVQGVQQDL